MAGERERVVVKGCKATLASQRKSLGELGVWGKNLSLSMNITEKLACPHTSACAECRQDRLRTLIILI